jgi:hypothetical protein
LLSGLPNFEHYLSGLIKNTTFAANINSIFLCYDVKFYVIIGGESSGRRQLYVFYYDFADVCCDVFFYDTSSTKKAETVEGNEKTVGKRG